MMGFDSRAAMVPGGAAEGFGNLGAALLLAPQIHRQDQMQMAQAQAQRDFQNRQLAQALQIAQMQDAREAQRWGDTSKWHEDEIERQKANDAARNGVAVSEAGRKWAGTLGTGALNLAGALGLDQSKASKQSKYGEYKPTLYDTTEEIDPETGHVIHKKVLKTPAEVDQERALWDRATLGDAVSGKAPATPDQAVVTARKARNARVQADQQTQGLAATPGKPAPAPSSAGVKEVMPPAAPPAAAPGMPTTTAPMPSLTKAHLQSKVADGTFPSFEAAYQDATSRGYNIADM